MSEQYAAGTGEQHHGDGVPPYGAQPYGAAQPYGRQPAWDAPGQAAVPPPYGMPQGYPALGYPGYAPMPHRPANGMGVAIFVTGRSGLLLCWVPSLGFLLAGVGVALSGVGMSQGKKTGAGTGLAIAGLVCGIIGLIPALIILIGVLASSPY